MIAKHADVYRCPITHARFRLLNATTGEGGHVVSGHLVEPQGRSYPITDGIPEFTTPEQLTSLERDTQREYDAVAQEFYDNAVDWLFASFYEDEDAVRNGMIDLLELRRDSTVLEIGSGTGRDSYRIAARLDAGGTLFLQDLSRKMVLKTRARIEQDRQRLGLSCTCDYFVSTATFLPFPDRYFDAVFHFGGFNQFGDKKAAMAEMARITKIGGKVVVGDESLPPWLEGTEYGEIICTNNALFRHKVPLESLPAGARSVVVRWVLGGCFYVIDFRVADSPPPINLDLPHKGWRGGTMRTRYFGRLEGVHPETRQMAIDYVKRHGLSLHAWLDELVRNAVSRDPEGGTRRP